MVSVAVIGAGAAGMAAARRLLAKNCKVVVFESQRSLGGVWQTTNEDSALYAALRTNLPKEIMAFDDLPFHQCTLPPSLDSGESDSTAPPQNAMNETSFVTALDVQKYLLEFARVFNLSSVIRLHTKVVDVVPITKTEKDISEDRTAQQDAQQVDDRIRSTRWTVTWEDLTTGEHTTDTFDSVVVCNGHYNERAIPKQLDLESSCWNGRTMHSKDYDTPDDFAGLVVVVVGAKSSGGDLALDLSKVAKEVHVCDPDCPSLDTDPASLAYGAKLQNEGAWKLTDHPTPNLWMHPKLVSLPANTRTVQFEFGNELDNVDVVIFATGYMCSFPFLSESVVQVASQAVRPLFEQTVHVKLPSLFFIGLPFLVVPFPMMDAQALLCASLLTGKAKLPDPKELSSQDSLISRSIKAGEGVPKNWHMLGPKQWSYVRRLLLLADELTPERERLIKWRRGIYDALGEVRATAYPGAVDTFRNYSLQELEDMKLEQGSEDSSLRATTEQ